MNQKVDLTTVIAVVSLCAGMFSARAQTESPSPEQNTPAATAETAPAPGASAGSGTTKPLSLVIKQAIAALDQYQKNRGGGKDALPPLTSADFDFATTADVTVGGSINLFIFKIGASHQNEVVNDVDFTYSVPASTPAPAVPGASRNPPPLSDVLARTIQSAAAAVKADRTAGKLPFSKLTVTIKYGVTWDVSGGANAPISFVTVGINGELKNNTVQSVKLVFGK